MSKAAKKHGTPSAAQGHHTTFVVVQNEAKPIQTDNHCNIEVVVLPDMMASNAFTTSQAALLYSCSKFCGWIRSSFGQAAPKSQKGAA